MDQIDPSIYKYSSLGLSFIGFLKSNFITQTVFTSPVPAYSEADHTLTGEIITYLEKTRDAYHGFSSAANVVASGAPDEVLAEYPYASDFVFSMFVASLF